MTNELQRIKKIIIQTSAKSNEGHVPSAFSILDILWVLYRKVLRYDVKNPHSSERDRFILSKGHASLGLYAILAEQGFFSFADFDNFGSFNGILGGHPDRNKVPGVEASTGSLGHGFPMSVGVALGLKIKNSQAKTFVIIGDGECNEGTIWESALLAAHHGLDNLCCIVDFNHSTDRALSLGELSDKFRSFGWDSFNINGHDHSAIFAALTRSIIKPTAIVAETIKGYGCKIMENNPAWHHKSPTAEELPGLLYQII